MCIEDLRRMARRNVPGVFFEYMEAGSYSEATRDANVMDMQAIKLRQRVLVDMSKRSLKTTVLGEELALPLAIAPIGLAGMQYADGEIHACRAAHAAGIQYTLSTMSICSIEDVAEAVQKPFWFQLYVMRDRAFVARPDRARRGGGLFRAVPHRRPAGERARATSTCATGSRCPLALTAQDGVRGARPSGAGRGASSTASAGRFAQRRRSSAGGPGSAG